MITGAIRSQVDKVWDAFWSGGVSNPLTVIEQITDLLFAKRLDDLHTAKEKQANLLKTKIENPIFKKKEDHLREHPKHKKLFHSKKQLAHFQSDMFHGNDFDGTMLRIGAMNMMLHGIESPNLTGEDSLSQDADAARDRYTLILANPPFKGSLNYDETAKDLLQMCKTKKTELLFLALFLSQLKAGGRCAAIVPDGVLFGSSKAHQQIREQLVDGQKLEAVIDMPSGVFKPYAGVSTAILIFTKTNSGGTDHVWFYHMTADGQSLDDKREPVEQNDIPDVLAQWKLWRKSSARRRSPDLAEIRDRRSPAHQETSGQTSAGSGDPRTASEPTALAAGDAFSDRKAKAFFVPANEIRENKYDLSINRYKEIEYEEVEYDPPLVILDKLEALEKEIAGDLKALRGMVSK